MKSEQYIQCEHRSFSLALRTAQNLVGAGFTNPPPLLFLYPAKGWKGWRAGVDSYCGPTGGTIGDATLLIIGDCPWFWYCMADEGPTGQ